MKLRSHRTLEDLLGPLPSAEQERPRQSAPPSRGRRGRDLALVGGAYEGASRTNRDLALWSPPLRSADADILYERDTSTGRTRDVLRNDAYVQSGEHLHRDGVVGSIFLLNCKPNMTALGIKDEAWEAEFQEEVENKFTLYAESPDCWIDASRMNTLTGLVRLAVGVHLSSGEILNTCEYIRQAGRPYKTAMLMVESERLSNPNFGVATDDVRGGIRRDKYGAPQSYFIRNSHPSDVGQFNRPNSFTWTEYPRYMSWGRQRVLHILEQQRIDQTRGISDMTTALKEMRVTKRFRDIVLQNAVVNATFAASIEAELPSQAYEALGGGDDNGLVDFAENYLGAVADYSGGSKSLTIDGVRIPHLFPGQKLQLRPAGTSGPLGMEMEQSLLRYIAANLGVSYEELSRDYSSANYSSMRAALQQTWRYMQSRKKFVADRYATCAFRLWFEEAYNAGILETMKGRTNFYDPMMKDAYTNCEWLGAGRGQIDELKETQASVLRINNRLSTYEVELARIHGADWRQVFKQAKREQVMLDDMELQPAENQAMMNAASGDNNSNSGDNPDGQGTKKPADKTKKGAKNA